MAEQDLLASDQRVAIIRTSDRSNFRRCRRKWHFESGLRLNRTPTAQPSYFWLGTGGHFAMEDFHGHNYYGDPVRAFQAYCDACVEAAKHHTIQVPEDFDEQKILGEGILEHYKNWIANRDAYKTVWIDGEPQVEVKCLIEIPPEHFRIEGYDKVLYQMTLDRLVEIDGEYWIKDWKFHKNFTQMPLEWHHQLTAYMWAAQAVFDVPVVGAILHEFRKAVPKPPRILQNGSISCAKDQLCTHTSYRGALIDMYGDVEDAPENNINCLNALSLREHDHADPFIRRQFTRRTPQQFEAEGSKILMELEDMLNPDLPLYTNPTKDCGWDCSNAEICLMMDRDDDWETTLMETTVSRVDESEEWRNYLK